MISPAPTRSPSAIARFAQEGGALLADTAPGVYTALGARPEAPMLDEWFGISFAFRWTGAVVASAVMAFPLAVRAVRIAIDAVDPAEQRGESPGGNFTEKVWALDTKLFRPDPLAD